ncbi:hypothetical protein Tco_1196180 [Tanacetum coccineum]
MPIRVKRLLFLGMEPRSTTSFTSLKNRLKLGTVRSNVKSKVISLSSKFVETREEALSPPRDVNTSSKEYLHPFSKIRNYTECHVLSFKDKTLLTGKGCDTPELFRYLLRIIAESDDTCIQSS